MMHQRWCVGHAWLSYDAHAPLAEENVLRDTHSQKSKEKRSKERQKRKKKKEKSREEESYPLFPCSYMEPRD